MRGPTRRLALAALREIVGPRRDAGARASRLRFGSPRLNLLLSPAGKSTCTACQSSRVAFAVRPGETLGDVLERLKAEPAFQLSNPSVRSAGRNLYMANPPALREATA